jgi:hypothetical protein
LEFRHGQQIPILLEPDLKDRKVVLVFLIDQRGAGLVSGRYHILSELMSAAIYNARHIGDSYSRREPARPEAHFVRAAEPNRAIQHLLSAAKFEPVRPADHKLKHAGIAQLSTVIANRFDPSLRQDRQ